MYVCVWSGNKEIVSCIELYYRCMMCVYGCMCYTCVCMGAFVYGCMCYTCVCMGVFVYGCMCYTYACVCMGVCVIHVCMGAFVYGCMCYTCVYGCICVWVYVLYMCVYGCICVWVYLCMGVFVYGCICVWVYLCMGVCVIHVCVWVYFCMGVCVIHVCVVVYVYGYKPRYACHKNLRFKTVAIVMINLFEKVVFNAQLINQLIWINIKKGGH